ncbi:MAG: peptide chain release factor N(5)-glutamine methyltransferase [Candidatus Rokuibacteriota bacterium]|nr:MAG: peptide chain release factor N(5)-glutamine methyltransferase [Candidatus Rokubacteria bacterium]
MRAAPVTPTCRAELTAAVDLLSAAGISAARVDAEWLLAAVLGVGRVEAQLDLDRPLPSPVATRYAAAVRRRARREPLQQVLGWEAFRGLRVHVTADVLVPRPETETLVEWALGLLPPAENGVRLRALDLGTGSGAIACALAAERSDVDVVAIDVSWAAAAVARDNARRLDLGGRVSVIVGDLADSLGPAWADLIVSNPPYLPSAIVSGLEPEVRVHEPRMALDGGSDGLTVIRRIVASARRALRPGAPLVLESAGGGQAGAVAGLCRVAGFASVAVRADLAGVDRFVAGRA